MPRPSATMALCLPLRTRQSSRSVYFRRSNWVGALSRTAASTPLAICASWPRPLRAGGSSSGRAGSAPSWPAFRCHWMAQKGPLLGRPACARPPSTTAYSPARNSLRNDYFATTTPPSSPAHRRGEERARRARRERCPCEDDGTEQIDGECRSGRAGIGLALCASSSCLPC